MFEVLVNLFFDKVKKNKKNKVLTLYGENREVKNLVLAQKNKEEKTSLSKYFCNIESLYNQKQSSISLSTRKARLQCQDFYQQ